MMFIWPSSQGLVNVIAMSLSVFLGWQLPVSNKITHGFLVKGCVMACTMWVMVWGCYRPAIADGRRWCLTRLIISILTTLIAVRHGCSIFVLLASVIWVTGAFLQTHRSHWIIFINEAKQTLAMLLVSTSIMVVISSLHCLHYLICHIGHETFTDITNSAHSVWMRLTLGLDISVFDKKVIALLHVVGASVLLLKLEPLFSVEGSCWHRQEETPEQGFVDDGPVEANNSGFNFIDQHESDVSCDSTLVADSEPESLKTATTCIDNDVVGENKLINAEIVESCAVDDNSGNGFKLERIYDKNAAGDLKRAVNEHQQQALELFRAKTDVLIIENSQQHSVSEVEKANIERELGEVKFKLKLANNTCEAVEKENITLRQNIFNVERKLITTQRGIDNLHKEISENDFRYQANVTKLHLDNQRQADIIAQLQADNDTKFDMITQLKTDNENLNANLKDVNKQKVGIIAQAQVFNKQQAKHTAQIRADNKSKDDLIANLETVTKQQADHIRNLEAVVKQKADCIVELPNDNTINVNNEKPIEIHDFHRTTVELDDNANRNKIAELKAEMKKKDELIAELRQGILDQDVNPADVASVAITELKTTKKQLEGEINELKSELELILNNAPMSPEVKDAITEVLVLFKKNKALCRGIKSTLSNCKTMIKAITQVDDDERGKQVSTLYDQLIPEIELLLKYVKFGNKIKWQSTSNNEPTEPSAEGKRKRKHKRKAKKPMSHDNGNNGGNSVGCSDGRNGNSNGNNNSSHTDTSFSLAPTSNDNSIEDVSSEPATPQKEKKGKESNKCPPSKISGDITELQIEQATTVNLPSLKANATTKGDCHQCEVIQTQGSVGDAKSNEKKTPGDDDINVTLPTSLVNENSGCNETAITKVDSSSDTSGMIVDDEDDEIIVEASVIGQQSLITTSDKSDPSELGCTSANSDRVIDENVSLNDTNANIDNSNPSTEPETTTASVSLVADEPKRKQSHSFNSPKAVPHLGSKSKLPTELFAVEVEPVSRGYGNCSCTAMEIKASCPSHKRTPLKLTGLLDKLRLNPSGGGGDPILKGYRDV